MNIRITEVMATILAAIIGGTFLVSAAYITLVIERTGSKDQTQTLEERIVILSSNLEQSSQAISDIEAEIAQRQQLVVQLQRQQQEAEIILRLNKEEVEAVAQQLRGEVRANERQSFWLNVGTSAFFFILGLIFPPLTSRVGKLLARNFSRNKC